MVKIDGSTHLRIIGFFSSKLSPTTFYENNTTCIDQIRGDYLKGDITKHSSPKLFYTHDLEEIGDITVQE